MWFGKLEVGGQITAMVQPLSEMKKDGVVTKQYAQSTRSRVDDISTWQSIQRYRVVGFVAMAAAFSASLDGYRKLSLSVQNYQNERDANWKKSTSTEESWQTKGLLDSSPLQGPQ